MFESTSAGISANGNVSSGEYTTKEASTYYWIASYTGDANNKAAATACGDPGESSVVNKAQPKITTSAVTPVTVGEKIKDTATLSELVNPDGKGTVTFKLYADSKCETTPVFESTSAGISANGNVSSGEYTTKEASTYYWIASYTGDANNKAAATACGDPGESSVVAVAIYDSNGKLVYSTKTDIDGWYMWEYKYTGKSTNYTVQLGAPYAGKQQTVSIKSNGYVLANFTGL